MSAAGSVTDRDHPSVGEPRVGDGCRVFDLRHPLETVQGARAMRRELRITLRSPPAVNVGRARRPARWRALS